MNREIKFRIWNRTYAEMFYPAGPTKNGDYVELFYLQLDGKLYGDFKHTGNVFCGDDYVIQQYTGLKDKNGKEIYEGDIVVENHDGGEGESNIGRVFFAAGTFMIDGDGSLYDHTYSLTPDILEDYLVIGNIFENPDLLK